MKLRRDFAVLCLLVITAGSLLALNGLEPAPVGASPLDCADVTGCQESATCGTSGSVTGCFLSCSDGAFVRCPKVQTQ